MNFSCLCFFLISSLSFFVLLLQIVLPTMFALIQKGISVYFPSATLYPPVHENLALYKKLLKNIPLKSGTDYQSFLDATTSVNESSTLLGAGWFNSTQTNGGRNSESKFWKRFSIVRKKSAVRSPPLRKSGRQEDIGIAMSDLLSSDPLDQVAQAQALADQVDQEGNVQVHGPPNTPPSSPASAAASATDNDPSLNEIKTIR